MSDLLTPERLGAVIDVLDRSDDFEERLQARKMLLGHIEALEERDRKTQADLQTVDADMSSRLRKIEVQVNAIADQRDRYREALERIAKYEYFLYQPVWTMTTYPDVSHIVSEALEVKNEEE